ncbi:MAG TPA: peptidase M14, partial [Acidobacteriota bacterium]|nr:peptidase M14 [Acidobacteriota bacterium]
TKALKPGSTVPVEFRLNREKSEPVTFQGVEFKQEQSSTSGSVRVIYGTKPMDFSVPFFRTIEVEHATTVPIAYLIPPQWTDLISRLERHHVELERTMAPVSGNFEVDRFQNVSWKAEPFEGRHALTYTVSKQMEERTFVAGSVLVRLNQRSNRVIMGLLEPLSTDSFVAWGFLDPIFEQKEYGEAYVVEALAEEMLKKNPELEKEFQQKLKSDPKFAADPDARLQFFYERSPYWDHYKNAYPVARITDESLYQRIPVR